MHHIMSYYLSTRRIQEFKQLFAFRIPFVVAPILLYLEFNLLIVKYWQTPKLRSFLPSFPSKRYALSRPYLYFHSVCFFERMSFGAFGFSCLSFLSYLQNGIGTETFAVYLGDDDDTNPSKNCDMTWSDLNEPLNGMS